MVETLKDVIAKLKLQQEQTNSQTQNNPTRPQGRPPKQQEEYVDIADEELIDDIPEKSSSIKNLTPQDQIQMEIEMLQNDGRFRAELLNQLQDLNKALVVIADVLVNLKR